ncbi:MAG: DedA family protein [Minisyncoccota bacterium]
MSPDIINHIVWLEQLSYLGLFLVIAASGHIIPISEDISLIIAGYITSLGYVSLWPMVVVSILASFTADTVFFWLSKKGSRFALMLERHISNNIFDYVKRKMQENTFRTMFLMRFVSGLRFASPLVAGYVGVPWKKFLTFNFLSACAFSPFFFFIGYFFHQKISSLISATSTVKHIAFIAIIIVLAVAVGMVVKKKMFRADSN